MTESRISYTPLPDDRFVHTPSVQLPVIILSESETKMIERIRQAKSQGRMVLIDPDSMTWYLVGKMENSRA